MRPTVDEQLRETCRILDDVIAPALNTEHAAEVLRSLMANLEMLQTSWKKVLPFLHWDNHAAEQLLRETGRSDDASGEALADPFDVEAVTARNDRLMGLLEQRIAALDSSDPALRKIRDHLLERASRYPMRSILPTPRTRVSS